MTHEEFQDITIYSTNQTRPREADYTTIDKILVVCAALRNLDPRLIS